MIDAVIFAPCAPALVPEVGRGLDAELGDVRTAIATAIAAAIARVGAAAELVVVGPGPHDAEYGAGARGSFAGFGVDLTVPAGPTSRAAELPAVARDELADELPATLAVGSYFAGQVSRSYAVGPTGATPAPAEGTRALLVLGDGSARRTEKAPGYLDPRAADYDAAVRDAIASGDPDQLAALDAGLGAELMAAGAPVWQAVAPLLDRHYAADLLYADAPFGVGYVVAVWQ